MVTSLALAAVVLRTGLRMRARRRYGQRPQAALRRAHIRLAKPAVALVVVGFLGGPISAVFLRDWAPFATLHAWLGLVAAALFVAAALLGLRLERGRSRDVDRHALLGAFAILLGGLAAMAGLILLP